MKKPYTIEDFEKDNFTTEELIQMDREVAEEVARIRGGARVGAGRKRFDEATKNVTFRFTSGQLDYIKEMGGSKWLRDVVDQLRNGQTCIRPQEC